MDMDTSHDLCCICERPGARQLGGRWYCDEHFALVNKPHPGFWRAAVAQILGLVVFTVVVVGLVSLLPAGSLTGAPLVAAGLVLAIVPAAVWLIYFRQQDRLEPEPKSYVLGVFLLALLITDVVGRRLILDFFRVADWITLSSFTNLAGSILIVGFTLEGIKWAAVRFSVYGTGEFDERMDGVVYGTAAGLGVATMLNLRFILDSGGADLGSAVIHVVVAAMAQASFGGITGYFLGEAKFVEEPLWWMPAGLTLAAVLNGTFLWLLGEVRATGISVDPWRGLVFGTLVALATFAALTWLMNRALKRTLSPAAPTSL
jgi:RsiW-degrading membrane proteinase PrsW (M82 family)